MKNKKPNSFCETPDEKCAMNYCDDNGCINRKRVFVNNDNSTSATDYEASANKMINDKKS